MLTDAQQRLVDLDLRKPEIEKYYEDLEQAIKDVVKEGGGPADDGIGAMFQAQDGTVYKMVKPAGTFVSYKELNYVRTKRSGEERGSLSVKEAQGSGFKVT